MQPSANLLKIFQDIYTNKYILVIAHMLYDVLRKLSLAESYQSMQQVPSKLSKQLRWFISQGNGEALNTCLSRLI